jgi:glucose-1-phosphate thymidylyltransferase
MKGIILAGGTGSRLYPLTLICSKQLLPVYDKPMIFYPLSTLMLAGIRDILLISTPHDLPFFKKLLGNGSHLGINLNYAEQPTPDGLVQAFLIGESFINNDSCALILGDNIFYGSGFGSILNQARLNAERGNSSIFAYKVKDPERFGVVDFDTNYKILSIEEKPSHPKSNFCVTGLYFYNNKVVDYAKKVKPSSRGELEITDLNNFYLKHGSINVNLLGRGFAWLDTGTFDSLIDASTFVKMLEERQGYKISVLEEIAFLNNWITKDQLFEASKRYGKSAYGDYIKQIPDLKDRN